MYVMNNGRVTIEGTPREVFSKVDELVENKLDVPKATRLAYELRKEGINIPEGILNEQELTEALCRL